MLIRTWQVEQELLVFTPCWIHSHIQPIHGMNVFCLGTKDLETRDGNFSTPYMLFQTPLNCVILGKIQFGLPDDTLIQVLAVVKLIYMKTQYCVTLRSYLILIFLCFSFLTSSECGKDAVSIYLVNVKFWNTMVNEPANPSLMGLTV